LFLLITACSNEVGLDLKKPTPFFERQKMAEILADVQLFETGIQLNSYTLDSANRTLAGYYDFIFIKHKIDSQSFADNFSYYLANPVEMDSVYQSTLTILSTLESKSRGIIIPDSNKITVQ
jgi:hypothetical protein